MDGVFGRGLCDEGKDGVFGGDYVMREWMGY